MKEQLITFETAKLANEKGFHLGAVNNRGYYYDSKGRVINQGDVSLGGVIRCNAPTQSLLQKWLRESRNIDISIESGWSDSHRIYECVLWENSRDEYLTQEFTSYEKALETGLLEALKLIK